MAFRKAQKTPDKVIRHSKEVKKKRVIGEKEYKKMFDVDAITHSAKEGTQERKAAEDRA